MGRFGLLESLGSYCDVYFVPANLRRADLSINSFHLHQLKIVHLVVRQKVFFCHDMCVSIRRGILNYNILSVIFKNIMNTPSKQNVCI